MYGHGLASSAMDGAASGTGVVMCPTSTTTKTLLKPTAKTV